MIFYITLAFFVVIYTRKVNYKKTLLDNPIFINTKVYDTPFLEAIINI